MAKNETETFIFCGIFTKLTNILQKKIQPKTQKLRKNRQKVVHLGKN